MIGRAAAALCALVALAGLPPAAMAAGVPERGFDLVVSAPLPLDPLTPTLFSLDPATGEFTRVSPTATGVESEPTFSPDGQRLAFVRGSRIGGAQTVWVSNADGSNARQVAPGHTPAWSPDGTELLTSSDPGVWVVGADGNGLRLVDAAGFSAAWSPQGKRIAYLAASAYGYDGGPLRVVDAAGGTPRTLVDHAGPFAWAPDGASIATTLRESDLEGNPLVVLDAESGTVRWQTLSWRGKAVSFSPDGRSLLFQVDQSLILFFPGSAAGPRRLVTAGCSPRGSWSPDGQTIACGNLLVDVASGGMRELGIGSRRTTGEAAWSPDGSRLVLSVEATSPEPALFRVNPTSGERIMIARGFPAAGVRWSPDGSRILLEGDGHLVRILAADGDLIETITAPAGYHGPTWSPDGRAILFVGAGRRLLLRPLSRGADRRAVYPGRDCIEPLDWSVSGTLVVRECTGRLVELPLRPTSHGLRLGARLVMVGRPYLIGEARWSPDGRRLAFLRQLVHEDACGDDCDVIDSDLVVRGPGRARRVERLPSPGSAETSGALLAWTTDGRSVAIGLAGGLLILRPDGTRSSLDPGLAAVQAVDWRPSTSPPRG